MKNSNTESFDTLPNVEKTNKLDSFSENSKLNTWIRKVEGTIFSIRYWEEYGYAYGIGNERISKWFETEQEVYDDINKLDWDVITRVMDCLMRHFEVAREIERRIEK